MQRLEVSGAVRLIYRLIGVKGLNSSLILLCQLTFTDRKLYSEIFPRIVTCSRCELVTVSLLSGVIPSSHVSYIYRGHSIKCGY